MTKKRKHIYMTEETIGFIEEWATLNEVNFSVAMESLVLMALPDTRIIGIATLLRESVNHAITHQYNRIAKLIVHTAVEAGAAKEAAQHMYAWALFQEMERYLDRLEDDESPSRKEFLAEMSVDVDSAEGKILLGFIQQRNGRFRHRAVTQIRKPVENLQDFLVEQNHELNDWQDHPFVQAMTQVTGVEPQNPLE